MAVCSLFALMPSVPDQVAALGDLVLHAGAFLALAMSGAQAYPRRSLWVIGAWLIGYGALIEVAQGLSGLRQADPVDLVVDVVATAAGLLLVGAGRMLRDRWRSARSG
jgi:VanZ family protein